MVTAEVNGNPEGNEFPFLMEVKDGKGMIVLFTTDEGSGMVVVQGSDIYPIGEWSARWDLDDFTPFTGSVTLRNS